MLLIGTKGVAITFPEEPPATENYAPPEQPAAKKNNTRGARTVELFHY
jgi:hypothetical protein